jgi:PAB-dependent poly(A)-specific ribonuclease subunit 2
MSTAYHPHQLLSPLPPPPTSHPRPPPHPTSLVFDPFSDLLWSGSSTGAVTAYASPQAFNRTVTFPAHGARAAAGDFGVGPAGAGGAAASSSVGPAAVKALVVGEREVVSLTAKGIGGRKRGGAAKWAVRFVVASSALSLSSSRSQLLERARQVKRLLPAQRADRPPSPDVTVSEGAQALNSMCMSPSNGSEIIAGGAQPSMMIVNSSTGSIVRSVESLPNILYLRRTPKYLAAGSADGSVRFHDPRTLKQTHALSAHLGGLSGLEGSGWNVLTFGYTVKCALSLPYLLGTFCL